MSKVTSTNRWNAGMLLEIARQWREQGHEVEVVLDEEVGVRSVSTEAVAGPVVLKGHDASGSTEEQQ